MVAGAKSKKVESYIRACILRGKWRPGERVPKESVIGSKLGVSYMTVKNVMSHLAEDGLLERSQKTGTFVAENIMPASIAILTKARLLSASPYQTRMMELARKYIESAGYRPVLKTGEGDTVEDFISSVHLLDNFVTKELAGVLSLIDLGPLEEKLANAGIHAVSVVSGIPTDSYTVAFDYKEMLNKGVQELRSKGYDDFAIMYLEAAPGEYNKPHHVNIRNNLLKAVEGDHERLVSCPFTYDLRHAYNSFKNYWEHGKRHKAIFFFDDVLFDVASRAILELGIKVPDELAIITQGNVGTYYHFPVSVTCVEFDPEMAVVRAWMMLDKLLKGEKIDESPVLMEPRIRSGHSL